MLAGVLCLLNSLPASAFSSHNLYLLPKPRRPGALQSYMPVKHIHLLGEPWPVSSKAATTEPALPLHLTQDIKHTRALVHTLCSVLAHSDDLLLMEREAVKMDRIYMDLSSELSRRPSLLRNNLSLLAQEYNFSLIAPVRAWHSSCSA